MRTPILNSPHFADDDIVNAEEAARILGISPNTLPVWRCTGRYNLPFVKVGRLVRYRRSDLHAWLERRARGGESNL